MFSFDLIFFFFFKYQCVTHEKLNPADRAVASGHEEENGGRIMRLKLLAPLTRSHRLPRKFF